MTADTDILSAHDFHHINWSSFVGCVKCFFMQNSGRPKYEVQEQNVKTVVFIHIILSNIFLVLMF
jgi:hypothetical protein